jgi:hypothetical protein
MLWSEAQLAGASPTELAKVKEYAEHWILAASVQELTQAYRESLERNDPDVDVFRVALIERLVMFVIQSEIVQELVRANAGEPEGD